MTAKVTLIGQPQGLRIEKDRDISHHHRASLEYRAEGANVVQSHKLRRPVRHAPVRPRARQRTLFTGNKVVHQGIKLYTEGIKLCPGRLGKHRPMGIKLYTGEPAESIECVQ